MISWEAIGLKYQSISRIESQAIAQSDGVESLTVSTTGLDPEAMNLQFERLGITTRCPTD